MESTDQKKDNTDNAPIRPVSSLLSHFENLSHTRSSSAVTAPHDSSLLKSPVQLDEPRHVAATDVSPGIRRHNRPMSMNLHDSPQLGPTLTVDSPRSPPRGFEERQLGNERLSRTPPPILTGHELGHGPGPSVSDETEQTAGAGAGSGVMDSGIGHLSPGESMSNRFAPRESPGDRKLKSASLPPPANRAGKPRIPAKPANLSHQDTGNGGGGGGGGSGLTPRSKRASSDLRVSPFSTPPSSPEKPPSKPRNSQFAPPTPSRPDVESPAQRLFEEKFPPPGSPRDARDLGFSRPKPPQRVPSRDTKPSREPTPLSVQIPSGQQQQQQRPAEPGSTVSSLPSAQRGQAGDLFDRPGLPPRREGGQGGRNGLSPSRATPTEYTYTHSVSRYPEPQQQQQQQQPQPQPQPPQQPQLPQRELQTPTLTRQPSYSRENKPGYQPPPPQAQLPPQIPAQMQPQPQPAPRIRAENGEEEPNQPTVALTDYPDTSNANRRPPFIRNSPKEILTRYDTRLMDVCGKYVCTTGYLTRVWDLTNGEQIMTLTHGETVKNISISFRPGASLEDEGKRLWLGTNTGEILEVDIPSRSIVASRSYPSRREVVKILRHKKEMWTMDDEGRLLIWPPDESGVPNLQYSYHNPYDRVAKGQTFSMVVGDELWLATGKDVHVYQPSARDDASFRVLRKPLGAQHTGEVTSGAYTTKDGGRVYLGHADGKVSVYAVSNFALLAMVNVSVYKISCLSVVGDYLWAGYKTGMIYVYDIHSNPWTVKKDWRAHDSPVSGFVLDTSSVWTMNRLQVTSLGTDNCIRLWDGTLESDWLDSRMQNRDVEFCTFREARAVIMTWNAGASTPGSVRTNTFIQDAIHPEDPPEILVFGFQELVDLEDKKITAKSLLMGSKKKEKKEAGEKEHMSRQYRVWIEHLTRCINDRMPLDDSYVLLHSANLIGLFTCVFIRHRERDRITNMRAAEVKRGMGGLYGNKGALVLRFLLDDSSVCLVNCHLAAGQTHTAHRNNDIAAILEAECLPIETSLTARANNFVSGGDGSMIMDHEICILNGDLNYRIDSIPRHIIIDAVRQNNLPKLLDRDQLLASRRKNPGFRLRSFTEAPITFAPTYKYDVGTDEYDSSDKKRSPAWCDRVLSRGRLQQVYYRRLEVRASDHRPVTAYFKMRVKTVSAPERAATWESCQAEFQKERRRLTSEASIEYLISMLGTDPKQARSLILG